MPNGPRLKLLTAAALALLMAMTCSAAYRMDHAISQSVEGIATYSVTAPDLKAKEWIVIAAMAPPAACQANVATVLSVKAQRTDELSIARRPVMLARVPARSADKPARFDFQVSYRATLIARALVDLGTNSLPATTNAGPALDSVNRRLYLRAAPSYDLTNATFVKWMSDRKLQRKSPEVDVDFARRVFLAMKKDIGYRYEPGSNRSASGVCSTGWSDCGGMANLFVAILRANSIPARTLVGRWATSAKRGDRIGDDTDFKQWHVKAEFFAYGVGWVPVDLSSAVMHDKSPDGLQYFGRDGGDFIVMHVDPDLEVNTVHFGKQPLHVLQGATWWATGEGTVNNAVTREDWAVYRR